MRVSAETRSRFWAKVRVERESGCWIWTAATSYWNREPWDGGYGCMKVRGRVVRAHALAYHIIFGRRVPRGMVLLHGCDNRRCVNVLEHIKPGTQAQNVAEMLKKNRAKHQRVSSRPEFREIFFGVRRFLVDFSKNYC